MNARSILRGKLERLLSVNSNTTVQDCIRVLNREKVGAVLIVDHLGAIEGIFTERDLLRLLDSGSLNFSETPVSSVMTPRSKLITANEDDSLEKVMQLMSNFGIRHIPVIRGASVVGLLSIRDVIKSLLDHSIQENRELRDYISGSYMVSV